MPISAWAFRSEYVMDEMKTTQNKKKEASN